MNLDFKALSEIDWNEIELDNIGDWPIAVKAICCTFVAGLVLFFSYSLLVSDEIDSYHSAVAKEVELRTTYRTKYAVASNLEIYRQQMIEMEDDQQPLIGSSQNFKCKDREQTRSKKLIEMKTTFNGR